MTLDTAESLNHMLTDVQEEKATLEEKYFTMSSQARAN